MFLSSSLFLFILWIFSTNGQHFEKSKSVWIEQGLVRGRIYKLKDMMIQMFRGIPYAEPPIGELRFRKPVKRGRWHRELKALEYGPPCIQFMEFNRRDKFSGENMRRESEDCLFLNVFSPYDPIDETKLYPIVVWIHGGSFLAGSADTSIDMEVMAENLISRNIVLVTINYRLGPLGFISVRKKDGLHEGNFGLWDQVLALEWVQANIRQFNGDPEQVTIMGESAGAASVSVLAVSPITKDWVHRAIILSGSSTAGWAIHRFGTPKWDVSNIASYLRCDKWFDPKDMAEIMLAHPELRLDDQQIGQVCNLQERILDCVVDSTLPSEKVLDCFRKQLNFTATFRKGLTVELGISKLVVDGELIPTSGVELIRNNSRIPIMIGVARREWSLKRRAQIPVSTGCIHWCFSAQFYSFKKYEKLTQHTMDARIRRIVSTSFQSTVGWKLSNATLDLIGDATYYQYLSSKVSNGTWELNQFLQVLQDLEADIEFVAPCQLEIDAYVENNLPVYAYSFDYVPRSKLVENEQKTYNFFGKLVYVAFSKTFKFADAFHGLDHAYLFTNGYTSGFRIEPFTKRDQQMSRMFCSMISNFVKTGNPTPTAWNNYQWLPYTSSRPVYTHLNIPPSDHSGELHWPVPTFWNSLVGDILTDYTISRRSISSIVRARDSTSPLTREERLQLNAYRRAWWALWLLVAVVAVALWATIVWVVFRKCTSPRAKPYDNIVVTTKNR